MSVKKAATDVELEGFRESARDSLDGPRAGVDDRSQGAGPEVVDWAEITLTARCNQRCFFCYEDARGNAENPTMEDIVGLLTQTKRHAEQVVLCGKEVLLRPDVMEIVRHASRLGLRAIVFTNGQALSREGVVAGLVEAGCDGVSVSYHFPDEEVFERGARVKGELFSKILDGLRAVAEHNRFNPGAALPVSTETDMFCLNAGRLIEMRQTLRACLGGGGWTMRLASLLPTRTADIGVDHVLDPMDTRRREILEVVSTQPEDVPLSFVKVPLCLLPEGHEHSSLDARYVYEGTSLTFNHEDNKTLTVDTFSNSISRDPSELMVGHPYRWVCRACEAAPLCRFERLDWDEWGFRPTREQRPMPYRPDGARAAAMDRLALPVRRRSVSDVLSGFGPPERALERVASMRSGLQEPYPEELVISSLTAGDSSDPALIDAWADERPVLALSMRVGQEVVGLRLATAREDADVGALVGYLSVLPLDGAAPNPAFLSCLRRLARIDLPPLDAWAATPWFDQNLGALLASAWGCFGERLWPGVGFIASDWRTLGVKLDARRRLVVDVEGSSGDRGRVFLRPDEEGGVVISSVEASAPAPQRRLLHDLRTEAACRLSPGFDSRQAETRAAAGGQARGRLSLVATGRRREGPSYRFFVTAASSEPAHYERVGDAALSHAGARMDRSARVLGGVLSAVMRRMDGRAPTAADVGAWRAAVEEETGRRGLSGAVEWAIDWT